MESVGHFDLFVGHFVLCLLLACISTMWRTLNACHRSATLLHRVNVSHALCHQRLIGVGIGDVSIQVGQVDTPGLLPPSRSCALSSAFVHRTDEGLHHLQWYCCMTSGIYTTDAACQSRHQPSCTTITTGYQSIRTTKHIFLCISCAYQCHCDDTL
jgi:hypothetical protein